jgi:ligand-binding sensor domain-containing protein
MNKSIKLIFAFAMILCIANAHAADWLNWSNFSKVTGMVREGSNIWIAGHGGVVKYDTTTQQKTYYIKTSGQLPSLMVEDMALNSLTGDIWIGTYDNGMVQIHNGQWTLHPYPQYTNLYHFAFDANGILWCATSAGLYKFTNNAFTPVNNINTSASWDVKVFPNGKLLVAGHQPVVYDPVRDTVFIPHTTVFGYNTSSIAIENDSSFYFAGEAMGISHIVDTTEHYVNDSAVVGTLLSEQIVQLKVINGQLNALTSASKFYQYTGTAWTTNVNNTYAQSVGADWIFLDNGAIWLGGAANGGVLKCLANTTEISLKKFALKSNRVTAISPRNDHEVWVESGSEIGLYNSNSNTFTQVNTLPVSPSYRGDVVAWNGTSAALTQDGIITYNGTTWIRLTAPGLPLLNLECLAADSSGNLYIGTDNGLFVLNGGTVSTYDHNNTLAFANNNDLIRKAYFDKSRNTMWFATVHGIVKLTNGVFTLINAVNHPQLSYYTYINCIAQDSSGNMWFGTAYGGLVKYDGTNYTLDSVGAPISNQTVSAIAFEGSTMYAADNVDGFWMRDNGIWTNYNTQNSDITCNGASGLYVDADHNVWITSTDYGTMNTFGIDIYNKTQVVLSIVETSETKNAVSVYPNPTNGKLTVRARNIHDGSEMMLTDMLGRDMGTRRVINNEIDISALPMGVYILHTTDLMGVSVRVVKE